MGTKKKIVLLMVFIFISLIVGVYFHYRNKREHNEWIVDQRLSNGELVSIKIDKHHKKLYRIPEMHFPWITIGGDDYKWDLYFTYRGQNYFFRTTEIPILLNIWDNVFYIAVEFFDSPPKEDNPQLRCFKYSKKWQSIKPEAFPKQIAIANIYFSMRYPLLEEPDYINQSIEEYPYSKTSRLWYKLKKNIDLYEKFKADLSFLGEYKKKYIDPFWSGKDFKEYLPVVYILDKNGNKVKYKMPKGISGRD